MSNYTQFLIIPINCHAPTQYVVDLTKIIELNNLINYNNSRKLLNLIQI